MFERLRQLMIKEPCGEIICTPLGFDLRILDNYDEVYIRIFDDNDASGQVMKYEKDLKNLEEISEKIEEASRNRKLNRVNLILKENGIYKVHSYLLKN